MSVAFGPVTSVDLTRATQLINKTNQFNATTRRYTADEVSRLVTAPENLAFQFRLVDRFGDNGLVSVMILRSLDEDIYGFEVDTWVMSCRVFGRQLEFEAMNLAVEAIRHRGIRFLRVDYMPTKKNGIISELFGELGFSRQQTLALPGTAIRWVLDIEKYIPRRTFIARRAQ
jgi:FkbH-like protein